jgi:hypothetical protein
LKDSISKLGLLITLTLSHHFITQVSLITTTTTMIVKKERRIV